MRPEHYSMLIQWDEEDNIYIVSIPELKIRTHGKTYEEAIKNALEVIEMWLEVAIQDGRPIPPPQKYVVKSERNFVHVLFLQKQHMHKISFRLSLSV